MDLHQQYLTKNNCYNFGKTIKPVGIMVTARARTTRHCGAMYSPTTASRGLTFIARTGTSRPPADSPSVYAFIGIAATWRCRHLSDAAVDVLEAA